MNSWNAMSYDGKDTVLRVVRTEAEQFMALADSDEVWEAPTGAGHWQVRDVVGHLVDTTEAYFPAFDAARSHTEVEPAYGLPGMAARVDERAQALRTVPRPELMERLRGDFDKMMEIFEALDTEGWGGLTVPHFYMGPLPAFFFPAFQLMDYGVHSWDIRQGTGKAHGLTGEAADLLTPFMYVLWKYTTVADAGKEPCELGIRITSGPNAGETLVRFYQELLEFPLTEIFENRDYQGSNHFFFDIGNGNLLAFFDFPGLGVGPYAEVLGGLHHIAISVTREKWEHLKGKLGEAGVEYMEESGASLYFRDPDGTRLELLADPLGEMYGSKVL